MLAALALAGVVIGTAHAGVTNPRKSTPPGPRTTASAQPAAGLRKLPRSPKPVGLQVNPTSRSATPAHPSSSSIAARTRVRLPSSPTARLAGAVPTAPRAQPLLGGPAPYDAKRNGMLGGPTVRQKR